MSDVSLREHVEVQIRWIDRYFEGKVREIHDNVTKAETQLSKRLEGMNEFRDTLKDQASRLATKEEVCLQVDALSKRVHELEMIRTAGDSRSKLIGTLTTVVISIVTALLAVAVSKAFT